MTANQHSRLTREQFIAALDKMGIDVVVEETYHDRRNGSIYVQWEFARGFRHKDGEINWNKQLDRIEAIRKARAEREAHNAPILARGGRLEELMRELPLPDWAME